LGKKKHKSAKARRKKKKTGPANTKNKHAKKSRTAYHGGEKKIQPENPGKPRKNQKRVYQGTHQKKVSLPLNNFQNANRGIERNGSEEHHSRLRKKATARY